LWGRSRFDLKLTRFFQDDYFHGYVLFLECG
jgi:hypothetical protein